MMLSRSILTTTIIIGLLFVVLAQSEQASPVSAHQSRARFPSMNDEEASQWLSTRNAPGRWRTKNNQQNKDAELTKKRLQLLNDNGRYPQHDTVAFEGVSMEVIFEMVYKQQNNAASR